MEAASEGGAIFRHPAVTGVGAFYGDFMSKYRLPKMLSQAAVSVLDQAWLSALNFMLGLALIRLATKDAYGVYAQLFAAGLFATSVLESVVLNPLVNLVSGRNREDETTAIGHMDRYQRRLGSVVALVLGAACAGIAVHTAQPHPLTLGIAFAAFIKANASREYARSIAFIEFQPERVLRIDVAYGAALILGVGTLAWFGLWRIDGIFAVLALANLVTLSIEGRPAYRMAGALGNYHETVRQAWKRGRLGLPGTILAWIVNYSYLYLAAAWLGASASADLNASRLLLMPISLSVVAWSRVARPRIGRLVGESRQMQLDRLLGFSLLALLLSTALYVVALWFALPWLQVHVLGGKYDNAGPLLLLWGIYFAVNAARWVGTAALMGKDRYGFMLVESVVCFIAMFVALAVAVPLYGVSGAVIALIAVEGLSLAMTWGIYWYARSK